MAGVGTFFTILFRDILLAGGSGPRRVFADCRLASSVPVGVVVDVGACSCNVHTLSTLSTLGKFFSRRHTEFFFLIFPRKQDLTFHW